MRFFPTILAGNIIQYPAKRRLTQRTVQNVTPSGTTYRSLDGSAAHWQWDLGFQDITALQRQQLDSLFDECRGRLHSFLFLDPFQNLVRHSAAFHEAVWERDASVVVTANQHDPFGGNRAYRLSNPSGTSGTLKQRLDIPAWATYTASCWLRASAPVTAELLVHPADTTVGHGITLSSVWQRHHITTTHASALEELHAGLKLPANTEIFAFGFQLEQYSAVSEYKNTNAESGIHANCRFVHDEIRWLTSGVDHHSARIRIQSPIIT